MSRARFPSTKPPKRSALWADTTWAKWRCDRTELFRAAHQIGIQADHVAGLERQRGRFGSATKLAGGSDGVVDRGGRQLAAGPLDVDGETPAGFEALHRAIGPGCRERGKKADLTGVALQQRLGDGGGEAEIGVGLVGAAVMKIVVHEAGNERLRPLADLLAVLEAGPHGRAPRGGKDTARGGGVYPVLHPRAQLSRGARDVPTSR